MQNYVFKDLENILFRTHFCDFDFNLFLPLSQQNDRFKESGSSISLPILNYIITLPMFFMQYNVDGDHLFVQRRSPIHKL